MDDALEQPTVADGMMAPLSDELGFGNLVNRAWIEDQHVTDPERLLADL